MILKKSQNSGGSDEPQFRHEFKYVIDTLQYARLQSLLPSVLRLDPHVTDTGKYLIRSLYFDDYYNSYYYDNESGADPREKFRVRIYNASLERISLELKSKQSGKTRKQSCLLTLEQLQDILAGKSLRITPDMMPILKKFCILQETRALRPKVIVEYERYPYIYEDDNVRVTLDVNLRTCAKTADFLLPELHGRPVMPLGYQLLEVKYDRFLPDHIYRTAQLSHLRQTAFSKYYLCRKFGGIE